MNPALLARLKSTIPYAAIAAVIILVLALAYCEGRESGRTAERVEQMGDSIDALERGARANETAAEERLDDARALSAQEKELKDARTHQGDDTVTSRARSLCRKLRQQGEDTSNHPVCCRFEGDAGACPSPSGL